MKILYTPLMIVPSVDATQRARILEAAGPGATFVEAKDPKRQAEEIAGLRERYPAAADYLAKEKLRINPRQSLSFCADSSRNRRVRRDSVVFHACTRKSTSRTVL